MFQLGLVFAVLSVSTLVTDAMALEESKRISKCSGCKIPSTEHDFGKVGPYCEGPAKDESLMLQACASPKMRFLGRDRRQCDPDVKLRPQPSVSVALPEENSCSQATLSLSAECRHRPSYEDNADSDDEEILLLQQRFQDLSIREKNMRKQSIIQNLRLQTEAKEAEPNELHSIEREQSAILNSNQGGVVEGVSGAQALTSKELKKMFTNKSVPTPLDAILQNNSKVEDSIPTVGRQVFEQKLGLPFESRGLGDPISNPQFVQNLVDPVEMYLNPVTNKDNVKALLIPDFVSKMTPEIEENVIDLGSNARLSVTYCNKRPKLREISLTEFNIANTRIMYRLIETGQLASYSDIKSYLCYTVKISQLAAKFNWHNVLKYDEEFRLAQAKYLFPWTYDSYHLYTTLLSSSVGSNSRPSFITKSNKGKVKLDIASENKEGKTICRNFNRFRGCQRSECNYIHACNRKFNDEACGLPHPGFQHFSVPKS